MELSTSHGIWLGAILVNAVVAVFWRIRVQFRVAKEPGLARGYRRLFLGQLVVGSLPWIVLGIGLLTGRLGSAVDILSPVEATPWVVIWWSVVALITSTVCFWTAVLGGAETLAVHPGVFGLPPATANLWRWLSFGVVAWTAAAFALLYWSALPAQAYGWIWPTAVSVFLGVAMINVFQVVAARSRR